MDNIIAKDSENNKAEKVHLSLMDNALDFLLSASEAVSRDPTPRNLKDAVLHVANGVELLVKSRLARKHWSLLFADVNRANRQNLGEGEFTSVDSERALSRLEQIVGVPIGQQSKDHLDALRKLRNRLTHFTANLEPQQANSLLATSMHFCVEFCVQQNMVTPDSEGKLGEIHTNLTNLKGFVDTRMASISESLRYYSTVLKCPECWQEALGIDGGQIDCKFCRYKPDAQDLVDMLAEGRIEDCPECGEEQTFVFIFGYDSEGEWVCCFCGVSGSGYVNCSRCDQMTYSQAPDVAFCEVCTEHIFAPNRN